MSAAGYRPVHSDPDILGGVPVFQGTRVPAQALLDYLADGYSVDEFVEFFPSVRITNAAEWLRKGDEESPHP